MFWIRSISLLAVVGLFVADFGFDAMAKNPPILAYAIPGLLALGIEVKALQRLVVQALRAFARISTDEDKK